MRAMFFRFTAVLALAALAQSAACAEGLVSAKRLSASLAAELAMDAVTACAQKNYHVGVVVLDYSGVQQVALRGDGAGIHTVDPADYKANTTLSFRIDGVDLVERSKTRAPPGPIGRLPRLLLAQGAVLIKAGDEIVGAIGISGARGNNMDTACARAGADKIKDRLK